MEKFFERKLVVNSTWTDTNIQMGLLPSLAVVQDNMCEYFSLVGCDGLTMIPACNSFLVLTKTKIHFYDFVKWLDWFTVKSEFVGMTRIKVYLDTCFKDINENLLATCTQELCAIDATERCIRSLDTTKVPRNFELPNTKSLEFTKLSFELTEKDYVETITINLSNLDFYRHTNNLEYIRIMLSLLDLKFMDENIITDFEIHYISESRLGEKLDLFKRVEDDKIYFEIKRTERVLTKAVLGYKNK